MTHIKNKIPTRSEQKDTFFWPRKHMIMKHTRFDTIEKAIKMDLQKKNACMSYRNPEEAVG